MSSKDARYPHRIFASNDLIDFQHGKGGKFAPNNHQHVFFVFWIPEALVDIGKRVS